MSSPLQILHMVVTAPAEEDYRWESLLASMRALVSVPPTTEVEQLLLAVLRFEGELRLDPRSEIPHSMSPEEMLKSLAIQALGGWTGLLWGGLVRIFLVHHTTWSVNSICHTFGARPFQTQDGSRNNWLVGLLALGEGWHNNHHAFPRSAFHGLTWWQIDPSAYFIRLLEATGLAWNVQRVTAEDERKRQQMSNELRCNE